MIKKAYNRWTVGIIHPNLCYFNQKNDAFSFTQKQDHYALELSVKVININYGTESRILKRCKPLKQYSLFVDAVRRNIALDREHGFEKAIKECIKKDILKDYLQRKSKEVINMLIGEYDYETDIAVKKAGKHSPTGFLLSPFPFMHCSAIKGLHS